MSAVIDAALGRLKLMHEHHQALGATMWTADAGSLYDLDLLAGAVLNRSLSLIRGFCALMASDNYSSAAALLRLQLDSCLRFYAASLVERPHVYARQILEGTHPRRLKDRHGNRMTDAYLLQNIAEQHPWFPKVYDATSGFIHLSRTHILTTVDHVSEPDSVTLAIGGIDDTVPEDARLEAIEAFDRATRILLEYVQAWVKTKSRRRSSDDPNAQEPRDGTGSVGRHGLGG